MLVALPVANAHVLLPWVLQSNGDRTTWWLDHLANTALHLVLLGAVAELVRRGRVTAHDAGLRRPSRMQLALIVAIVGASAVGMALRQAGWLAAAQANEFSPTTGPERAMFLAAGLVIGAAQEPLWRAFAYHALRQRLSVPFAVVGAAISFGYFHGSVAQALFTGAAAVGLSWLYLRRDDIWWPILLHVAFNGLLAPFA